MWLHAGAWKRTAALCSLIANCNRDAKKKPRPFTPDDFDPTVRRVEHKDDLVITFDQFVALASSGRKGAA